MEFVATYNKETKVFATFADLLLFNKKENKKHYNLIKEMTLKELVSEGGLIVTIEGDNDLYDGDLSKHLNNLDNYLLLNNIYDNPHKLLELKDLRIDTLFIQSTGLRSNRIEALIHLFKEQVLSYPKNLVCVIGNEDDFLSDLIEAGNVNVFTYDEVTENEIILSQWLGADYVE